MLLVTLEGRIWEGAGNKGSLRQIHLKMSWRGLIKRVFQLLQHVICSCGQRDFPSPDALALMKDADIVPEKISHLDDVTDQQSLEVMLPFPGELVTGTGSDVITGTGRATLEVNQPKVDQKINKRSRFFHQSHFL